MGRKGIFIVLLLIFTGITCFAQNTVPDFRRELEQATTDTQKLNVYRHLFDYYKNADNDTLRRYLEPGLQEFSAHNYTYGKAILLGMLSGIYSEEGMSIASQNTGREALRLFTLLKDGQGIAKIHNTLGVTEGRKGNFDEAVRHFLQALQYFESVSDTANIVNTYVKLGTANSFMGNSEKSLDYYRKGLRLSLLTKESANTAYLYNNIGNHYGKLRNYDSALYYFKMALAISERPGFIQARVAPLMNIGAVYAEKGDTKQALDYYNQALAIARDKAMPEDMARLLHSIGLIENEQGHYNTKSLKNALEIARQTGDRNLETDILGDLARIAGINGAYKDQVDYMKQERAIHDTLFTVEKAKEIANLQAEYELNKSNEQLSALRVSEQKNLQQKNVIIIIAVFLALTLATLLFFFVRMLKLNKTLSQRSRELQEANRLKDRLFSIIGHDLRGPVGNIPALLNIYRDAGTTDEQKGFILDSLEENSQASLETLDKLLNWGKMQLKGHTLNQSWIHPSDIIDENLRLFRVAAAGKNISVVNNVADSIVAFADEDHFKFVVRNLLSNAIKYSTDNSTVLLSAEVHPQKNEVLFSVKDSGIGIGKGKLEQIFQPYNESTRGTANETGNSIGLMLCREFILQNGGNIWAESEKGKGSVFYFTLKAQPPGNA